MKTFGLLAWFRVLRAELGRFPGAAKVSATELGARAGANAFYRAPGWLMLPVLVGTWLASRKRTQKSAGMPAPSSQNDDS